MSASAAPRITRSTISSRSSSSMRRSQLTLLSGTSSPVRSASERSAKSRPQSRNNDFAIRRTAKFEVSAVQRSSSVSALARMGKAIAAARVRAVHVVIAVVILVSSLFGSLLLRTQMVQDSFAITQTQQSIGRLTQDIQEKQVQLEKLQASLPNKASDLGMVPGAESVTIDVSGAVKATH